MKQTLIRYSSKYVESKLTEHGVKHSLTLIYSPHNNSQGQNRNISTATNSRGEIRMSSKSVWDQATKGNTKYN